ncbi:MAG: hypothetical protein WD716_06410 [Fimbriimonadaceae bacterium]
MGTKRQGRPKWPWILGGVVGSCLLLIGLLGFVTGVGPYDLPSRSRELDDVIAESRRLGLPMTAAELLGPAPSPDDNAAPGVFAAIELLEDTSDDFMLTTLESDPALQSQQAAWLQNNSAHLDAISALLREKPAWRVERDYDLGPNLLLPEFATLKKVAKTFGIRGVRSAREKDTDLAINDFVASRRLAEKLATEPTLIGLLVSIAINSICLRTIESYADSWRGDAARLRALEDAVAGTMFVRDPRIALRGEFYMELVTCRNLQLYGGIRALTDSGMDLVSRPAPHPSKIKRTGLPRKMFERASLTTIAEAWNEVFAAFRDQGDRNAPWGDIMERRTAQMEGRYRASEILAQILFPVFSQAQLAISNDEVNQNLALAFVRAFRHRAENGKWPKDLEEIESAFPDPFNPGKTIQAKFSDTEVRVWSVGRDKKDDGGLQRSEPGDGDDTAFVWPPSLRRPPE